MYANVVSVTIHDWEAAQKELDELIPMVSSQPGFQRGIWVGDRSAAKGYGIVVFDTKEAAEAAVARVPPGGPGEPVTRHTIETLEVLREA